MTQQHFQVLLQPIPNRVHGVLLVSGGPPMQRVCRTYDGSRYRLIHWKIKAVWSDRTSTGLVLPGQFARQMVTNAPANDIFRQTSRLHEAFPKQLSLGQKQLSLGHKHLSMGHKQLSLGHKQLSLGHRRHWSPSVHGNR